MPEASTTKSVNNWSDNRLPLDVRLVVLSCALLQAQVLYQCYLLMQEMLTKGKMDNGLIAVILLGVCLPPVVFLAIKHLNDKRFWQHLALLAVVQCALLAWSLHSLNAPDISNGMILPSLPLLTFVLLPWLQVRQQYGQFRVPYTALFELAWQNCLALLLAAFFTGVCWLVLILWAALFNIIGIKFFAELFANAQFIYTATCLLLAQGVLLARSQHKAVQIVRQIKFALFKGLLPVVALIALLFVVSLPFSGLAPLWQTGHATWLLCSLIGLLVLFANAVWQDGKAGTPYPLLIRRLVEGALLMLPGYAALALYALWLRIDQYGFTVPRFLGLLAVLLISGYALGYALAVLWRRTDWLAFIAPVNKLMSWLVILLVVLVNSPLLDPYRISAGSQLARLADEADSKKRERILLYLRFDSGRAGYQALQALQSMPSADSAVIAEILAQSSRKRRFYTQQGEPKKPPITDIYQLRDHLLLAEGSQMLDENWLQQLLSGDLKPRDCQKRDTECVARLIDLDADGKDEVLLCEVRHYNAICHLHAQEGGRWRNQGELSFYKSDVGDSNHPRALKQALMSGTWQARQKRWPMLSLNGGKPVDVSLETGVNFDTQQVD